MKKLFSLTLLFSFSVMLFAQSNMVSLNEALKQAAEQFSSSLKSGTTVAILGISSPREDLSDYMLDELTTNIVQSRKLQVVTRTNLDVIQNLLSFI